MSFPFSFWKFSPLSLPVLSQWYSADKVDGSNNAIDRSGSGNTGTNSNVTIVANVVSGLPVFRFNGTNAKFTYPTQGPSNTFSAFAFIKATGIGTATSLICWINPLATNQILSGTAGPKVTCYDGANQPASNVVDDYDSFSLMGVVCSSGTCTFYQNGVSIGVGASTLNNVSVSDFGGSTSFFAPFDCTELVFYGSALTAAQVSELTQYFRGKSQF